LQDVLELTFVRPAGARVAKLVVSARQTGWAAILPWEFVSLHGSGTRAWFDSLDSDPVLRAKAGAAMARVGSMEVALRAPDGWRVQGRLDETGPEIGRRQVIPLDLRGVEGDTVYVVLRSTPAVWMVDKVGIDSSADEPERQ
jgi:hypothetical protein